MKRHFRIEGNIAIITLTQGKEAVIDAFDLPLVSKWTWHAHKGKRTFYAARQVYVGNGRTVRVLMHTAITGFPLVDHRDGDGLNNRRGNLREATQAQNCRNARLRKDNRTGVKGVSNVGGSRPFRARIKVHGKTISLGTFATLSEAAAAYAEASQRHHGEFGRVA